MDRTSSCTQVMKSGQMKATSTSAATSATLTSGSSFAGAAAGGSSGAAGASVEPLFYPTTVRPDY